MKGLSLVNQILHHPENHDMLGLSEDTPRLFFIQRRVNIQAGQTLMGRGEKRFHTSIISASSIEGAQEFYEQAIVDDLANNRKLYWNAPTITKFGEYPIVKVTERLMVWEMLLESHGILIVRPGYYSPVDYDEPVLCYKQEFLPKGHEYESLIQVYAEADINEAQTRLEQEQCNIHSIMISRAVSGYIADIMPSVFQ